MDDCLEPEDWIDRQCVPAAPAAAASLDRAATGLWPFALEFYARPGVSKLLIGLQDDENADILILLALLFAADMGAALDAGSTRQLVTATERWRRDVIEPLREVRRLLRGHPLDGNESVRTIAKKAELAAEKIALSELARLLPTLKSRSTSPSHAVALNFSAYREVLSAPSGAFDILAATFLAANKSVAGQGQTQ